MNTISLTLHDVVEMTPTGDCPVYTIDRLQLRQHLQAIRQAVGAKAVRQVQDIKAPPDLSVCLTFDDGAKSARSRVLEELARFDWPGHFFVVSDWIGRDGYMDAGEIRELRQCGHVVGSHSRSHPERMASITFESMFREWSDSCGTLSGITGERIRVASLPNGFYSRRVAEAAAAAGIKILFTSEPTTSRTLVDGCLVLGRYTVQRSTPSSIVAALAAGAPFPRWEQAATWFLKKAAKRITGESYLAIRRSLLSKGLRF